VGGPVDESGCDKSENGGRPATSRVAPGVKQHFPCLSSSPTATTVIRRAETLAGTGVLPAPWGIERHDKKLEIRRNRLVTETLELSITGARSIKFKGFKLQPLSLSLRHGAAKDLD